MSEPTGREMSGYGGYGRAAPSSRRESASLADILERVLDKGIVIAGDIQVNLLDIELLTIKLRLVIVSVDRAKEMGIDWWEHDPTLSSGHRDMVEENRRLRERVADLEAGTEDYEEEYPEELEEDADRYERRRGRRLEPPEEDRRG